MAFPRKTASEQDVRKPKAAGNVRSSLFWIVLVALALRLVVMSFVYQERTDPARDHWRLGGEAGRIARSIAQGEGFSNPLFGKTGPTAWLAPVFPYLLAGIFKIFGIHSKASAIATLALDCSFSALTCIPIYFIASKNFGEDAAVWAGWIWAFFPYAIFFSADFIWATTPTTLLVSLIFFWALHLETSSSLWHWAGFGALCGLGGLTDPGRDVSGAVSRGMGVLPTVQRWESVARSWPGSGDGRGRGSFAVVPPELRDISQSSSVSQLPGPRSVLWKQPGLLALGTSGLSSVGQRK